MLATCCAGSIAPADEQPPERCSIRVTGTGITVDGDAGVTVLMRGVRGTPECLDNPLAKRCN